MRSRFTLIKNAIVLFLSVLSLNAGAQELNAKIVINHAQVSTSRTSVFENLENSMTAFLNERQWTGMQYKENEKINCTFSITIAKYDEAENRFTATAQIQSTRPVFNATYTTTVLNVKDEKFNFDFQEFDQLNFTPEQVDNNLTAMLAYYAYLIIGMDMDTMAPKGGTEVLRQAENIVNNAQNLGFEGWKAFDDSKNRFAIINDYLDGGMEPFRDLQYVYYRNGLDTMADNVETGRAAVFEAMQLLKTAHENKALSSLPQFFTDYKRDEIISIFGDKSVKQEEKETVYDIVSGINASQNDYWDKIKK